MASWEVAEIVYICRANGYIQPTAYQGIYNVLHRYDAVRSDLHLVQTPPLLGPLNRTSSLAFVNSVLASTSTTRVRIFLFLP